MMMMVIIINVVGGSVAGICYAYIITSCGGGYAMPGDHLVSSAFPKAYTGKNPIKPITTGTTTKKADFLPLYVAPLCGAL